MGVGQLRVSVQLTAAWREPAPSNHVGGIILGGTWTKMEGIAAGAIIAGMEDEGAVRYRAFGEAVGHAVCPLVSPYQTVPGLAFPAPPFPTEPLLPDLNLRPKRSAIEPLQTFKLSLSEDSDTRTVA